MKFCFSGITNTGKFPEKPNRGAAYSVMIKMQQSSLILLEMRRDFSAGSCRGLEEVQTKRERLWWFEKEWTP